MSRHDDHEVYELNLVRYPGRARGNSMVRLKRSGKDDPGACAQGAPNLGGAISSRGKSNTRHSESNLIV